VDAEVFRIDTRHFQPLHREEVREEAIATAKVEHAAALAIDDRKPRGNLREVMRALTEDIRFCVRLPHERTPIAVLLEWHCWCEILRVPQQPGARVLLAHHIDIRQPPVEPPSLDERGILFWRR